MKTRTSSRTTVGKMRTTHGWRLKARRVPKAIEKKKIEEAAMSGILKSIFLKEKYVDVAV